MLPGQEHVNLWTTSLKARSLWASVMMAKASEGLAAVHTVRNMIISVSLLAAADAALIAQLLNILTDPAKLKQIDEFASADPISNGDSFMSAAVKVALALGAVALSLLVFAQCVRISVHLGFLIRVVPENLNTSLPLKDATIVLVQRASLFFALGLRFLYAFVPLSFYMSLGSLAFLISTVLLLVALIMTDVVPAGNARALLRQSDMDIHAASLTESDRMEIEECSQRVANLIRDSKSA